MHSRLRALLCLLVVAAAGRTFAQDGISPGCRSQGGAQPIDAPWYYHYDQGVGLAPHDPARALEALTEAAQRRPKPGRFVRTYGVWRIDYEPYLQLARVQARLGRWECAIEALSASVRLGETEQPDQEREHLRALLARPR